MTSPNPKPPPPRRVSTSWWLEKRPVVLFTARFSLLMAVFYVVSLLPWVDRVALPAYMHLNAAAGAAVLNTFGQGTHAEGIAIRSAAYAVNIRRGCDAIEPSWLLAACVLAFPAGLRAKFGGILAGVVLLHALNLVRITSLFLVGPRWPALFETLHLEIWPVAFIAAAIALWFLWLHRLRPAASPAADAAA